MYQNLNDSFDANSSVLVTNTTISTINAIWEKQACTAALPARDRPRFFDQVGHQTTNASIGNKHFFTK